MEGDGLVTRRHTTQPARPSTRPSPRPAARRHRPRPAGRRGRGHRPGPRERRPHPVLRRRLPRRDRRGERGDGPQTLGYWAQLVATEEEARDTAALLGAHGLGGDLNIDGSIGSRTAHLREPYADADGHCGNPYLPVEQVRDHIAACSQAGIQAGFHVIGDAGVHTAIAGIEAAAALVGADTVRRARHRLEHLEMIDAEGIARLVALGVTASVQPAFDAHWGGGAGMYAARLGRERAWP